MIPTTIRIVLIDDQAILVDSLANCIDAEEDLTVVGKATNPEDGLRLIHRTAPHVALVDIMCFGRGSFDVASGMAAVEGCTRIIILSGQLSEMLVDEAVRLDVRGYLMKSEPLDVVIESIRYVARDNVCLSSEVKRHLQ